MEFIVVASGITFGVFTHYLSQWINRENYLEAGKKNLS